MNLNSQKVYIFDAIRTLLVAKIQHWQKVQNFTGTHNLLAFSNTTIDSKLILKCNECPLLYELISYILIQFIRRLIELEVAKCNSHSRT